MTRRVCFAFGRWSLTVGLVLLTLACLHGRVSAKPYRSLLQEATNKLCQPETLEPDLRCQYVREHRAQCAPRSGLLDYLAIYYCWDLQYWDIVAVLLVVLWIACLFLLMFTASDRFFCPAMELLSEYLRLSPAVAGATLLALGNGAPDVFTQIAAASSGSGDGEAMSPESLSMALSEPLGTGLFVGNVVLGLTVAMARGLTQQVDLKPTFFMKDALFYLCSVGMMFAAMIMGTIHLWQCILLMVAWFVYIWLTIHLSKGEDVVQLDPLHHEVPRLVPYGPWDDLDDTDLEDWDWLSALFPEESLALAAHAHAANLPRGSSALLRQQHPSLVLSNASSGARSLPGRSHNSTAAPYINLPVPLHKRLALLAAAAAAAKSNGSAGSMSGRLGSGGERGHVRQPSWLMDLRERSSMVRRAGSMAPGGKSIRRRIPRGDDDLEAPLLPDVCDSDSAVMGATIQSHPSNSWPPNLAALDGRGTDTHLATCCTDPEDAGYTEPGGPWGRRDLGTMALQGDGQEVTMDRLMSRFVPGQRMPPVPPLARMSAGGQDSVLEPSVPGDLHKAVSPAGVVSDERGSNRNRPENSNGNRIRPRRVSAASSGARTSASGAVESQLDETLPSFKFSPGLGYAAAAAHAVEQTGRSDDDDDDGASCSLYCPPQALVADTPQWPPQGLQAVMAAEEDQLTGFTLYTSSSGFKPTDLSRANLENTSQQPSISSAATTTPYRSGAATPTSRDPSNRTVYSRLLPSPRLPMAPFSSPDPTLHGANVAATGNTWATAQDRSLERLSMPVALGANYSSRASPAGGSPNSPQFPELERRSANMEHIQKRMTLQRPPSARQLDGAMQLFKQTSNRYAYSEYGPGPGSGGGSGTAGGATSNPALEGPNPTSTASNGGAGRLVSNGSVGNTAGSVGGSAHGGTANTSANVPPPFFRSKSLNEAALAHEALIPLLLDGKLQELRKALEKAAATQGSQLGSPIARRSNPGSPHRMSSTGAPPDGPEFSGGSGYGGVAPKSPRSSVPSYTEQELQVEQKRLMKMLYYGHKQQQKLKEEERAAAAAAISGGTSGYSSPGSTGTATATTLASRQGTMESVSAVSGGAGVGGGRSRSTSATGAGSLSRQLADVRVSERTESMVLMASFSTQAESPAAPQNSMQSAGSAGLGARRRQRLGVQLQEYPEDEETGRGGPTLEDLQPFMVSPDSKHVQHIGFPREGGFPAKAVLKAGDPVDQQLTEEVMAGVEKRVERMMASRQLLMWQLWRALRRPLVLFLSFTMPMIERRQELHYQKYSAIVFPIIGPTLGALYAGLWVPWSPDSAEGEGAGDLSPLSPLQLKCGLVACCCTSILVLIFWRKDGLLQGPVLGICTVLCFIGSMLWMNLAADELVGLLVAVGHVLELPAALLGATVLAWGNSLSDAVSNLTMARDGYPTMAFTACFASPLFILLAGVACTLSAGAVHGPVVMPQDTPTMVLYATSTANLLMWSITIPFIFKFKLDKRITYMGVGFYILFQVAYVVMIMCMGIDD